MKAMMLLWMAMLLVGQAAAGGRVLEWMCLERCNYTAAQVQEHLQQVANERRRITKDRNVKRQEEKKKKIRTKKKKKKKKKKRRRRKTRKKKKKKSKKKKKK